MSPPSFCPLFPGSRMNPSMGLGGDIPAANAPGKEGTERRLPFPCSYE